MTFDKFSCCQQNKSKTHLQFEAPMSHIRYNRIVESRMKTRSERNENYGIVYSLVEKTANRNTYFSPKCIILCQGKCIILLQKY